MLMSTPTTFSLIGTTKRMSKRYFKIETIHDYDTPTERQETVYESAQTAREMLLKRGVHLGKDEKATSNHRYFSETGEWFIYWRCSREETEND
jgi:hypothetical protein